MISLMPNTSMAIQLDPAERTQLEKWESSYGTPQQVALRCRIILGALAGQDNMAIAEQLGVSRPTVQLWRKRVRDRVPRRQHGLPSEEQRSPHQSHNQVAT